jgi:hypothetical protein
VLGVDQATSPGELDWRVRSQGRGARVRSRGRGGSGGRRISISWRLQSAADGSSRTRRLGRRIDSDTRADRFCSGGSSTRRERLNLDEAAELGRGRPGIGELLAGERAGEQGIGDEAGAETRHGGGSGHRTGGYEAAAAAGRGGRRPGRATAAAARRS